MPAVLLIVPAALLALVSLVVPTVQTVIKSFQQSTSPFSGSSRFAGLRNYTDVVGSGTFWSALGFSLLLALVSLVVAVLVAPALAVALDRGGVATRRVGRVLLSVPLVVFSPVAVGVAWSAGQRPGSPGSGIATMFGRPDTYSAALLITAVATSGVVCGLALLVFLPVLRGRGTGRVRPTMATVGVITVLATVAICLQAFSFVTALGEPGGRGTLTVLQAHLAFLTFQFGRGAAVATVTGVILGVLGVGATLIAIVSGLRIGLVPAEQTVSAADRRPGRTHAPAMSAYGRAGPAPGPPSGSAPGPPAAVPAAAGPGRPPGAPDGRTPGGAPRRAGVAVAVLSLAAVLAVCVIGVWPWLSGLFSSGPDVPAPRPPRMYVNTWLPPLLGAVVSVGAAFLAALGIGGLRPLGRRSEWLLLPFSPWLFVGVGPLGIAGFDDVRRLKLLGHFVALIPPILLSVPALVVLTLFCRGRSAAWRAATGQGAPAAPSFFRLVVFPVLPLAGLLTGATVQVGAQGLLWPWMVSQHPTVTAPVELASEMGRFSLPGRLPLGLTSPLSVVVPALIALVALQLFHLDRLVVTTGPSGDPYDDPPSRFRPAQAFRPPYAAMYGPPPPSHGSPAAPYGPPGGGPPPARPSADAPFAGTPPRVPAPSPPSTPPVPGVPDAVPPAHRATSAGGAGVAPPASPGHGGHEAHAARASGGEAPAGREPDAPKPSGGPGSPHTGDSTATDGSGTAGETPGDPQEHD